MTGDAKYEVLEFGVYEGYTTKWWLRHASTSFSSWIGFDLFTGLPQEWRELPVGTFNTSGPPPIEDPRVRFVVGDVKQTVQDTQIGNHPKLIFFDLDLFEPSLACWRFVRQHLRPNDLLIFDEAFDKGERSIIQEHVLCDFEVEAIAHTCMALAIKIVRQT